MFLRVRALDENGDPAGYINLTGTTPKAQMRAIAGANDVDAEFTCTIGNQALVPGSLFVELDHVQTAALGANGVYDVQVTHIDGRVVTYLAGTVTVIKEVTRDD